MRGAGGAVLLTLLVLGTAQAVGAALSVLLVLVVIVAACTRPAEMAGLLGFCLVATLAETHGLAFMGLLALLAVSKAATRRP